jgi:hypothetical protein
MNLIFRRVQHKRVGRDHVDILRGFMVCIAIIIVQATIRLPGIRGQAAELPIFDTHVHYSQPAWTEFPPEKIIDKLKSMNISRAVVSSSPDDGTRMLYKLDPERIVPFLRPYRGEINTSNWYSDTTLIPYLNSRLEMPIYQGIGEFHLQTVTAANSPIVRETVKLAVDRGLYLHIHGNAEAVRAVFGYEPKVKILWAHAGMIDPPEVVAKMLDEFQNLWADTSYREYAISPSDTGKLDPTWEAILVKYADRIMIGTDTWVVSRWSSYEELIKFNRRWLNQLPREVAEKIAYGNAVRLFGAKPRPATATP